MVISHSEAGLKKEKGRIVRETARYLCVEGGMILGALVAGLPSVTALPVCLDLSGL